MITTNTGAKKLESSDNWREIFPNPGTGTAGAHNATVDAQDRIQAEIAPIINGKQCALGAASGDYVLLRNSTITGKSDGAYIATKAIPANTDIDSTYLGNAITGGISNSLNNNFTKSGTAEYILDKMDASGASYSVQNISKFKALFFAKTYTSNNRTSITNSTIVPLSLFKTMADGLWLYDYIGGTSTYNMINYVDDTHIYFKQDNAIYRSVVYGIY